jgi:hypothetical protein
MPMSRSIFVNVSILSVGKRQRAHMWEVGIMSPEMPSRSRSSQRWDLWSGFRREKHCSTDQLAAILRHRAENDFPSVFRCLNRAYSQPSKGLQVTKMSKIWWLMPQICDGQNGNGRPAENTKTRPRAQSPSVFPHFFLEGSVIAATEASPLS